MLEAEDRRRSSVEKQIKDWMRENVFSPPADRGQCAKIGLRHLANDKTPDSDILVITADVTGDARDIVVRAALHDADDRCTASEVSPQTYAIYAHYSKDPNCIPRKVFRVAPKDALPATNGHKPDVELDVSVDRTTTLQLEKEGFRVASERKPSRLSEALRDELIDILSRGDDKNNGAFTVAVAAQVERLVASAKDILVTEQMAGNDVGALLMNGRRKQKVWPYGGIISGEDDETGTVLPYGAASPNENFGVQAIRQLVEGIRGAQDSPARLVEALSLAREKGLHDVATSIEARLGIAKPEPTSEVQEWICGKCGATTTAPLHGVCPSCMVDGQLRRVEAKKT